MAIFHLNIQIITRGKGKSAVAAAAYRSGTKLTNDYNGETHDYTHKGGVTHSEIILPDHAPKSFLDRSTLWNSVEKIENAKNSQLAREMNLAFPYELTAEQNLSLVRKYVTENFVNAGMCADVCIHEPDRDTPNPHAHIMLTMRPLNPDGSWGAKCRKEYMLDENGDKIRLPSGEYKSYKVRAVDWNDQTKAEEWRASWATAVNAELESIGSTERIDHRSYQRQGINQIPTVHLGVAATQMEQKGIRTERGNLNREIAVANSQLKQLRARIKRVKSWLDVERNNTPPTLYEVLNSILDPNVERSHYKQIADLKLAASTLVFIQQNHISDLGGLADTVNAMSGKRNAISKTLKDNEHRTKTLDEHIRHGENFSKYRKYKVHYEKLYSEYKTLRKIKGFFADKKTQKALDDANEYYETHRPDLAQYDSAEDYLKKVMQSHFNGKPTSIPLAKWQSELADKKLETVALYKDYHKLKDETQSAEAIKRFAADLMIPDEPKEPQQKQKSIHREESL